MREAPGKREAPPSSLKFETIEVNCTRYRILVFSTVALIRKEKDVGEIAREEGEEEEDCGRRSKGVYFLPANLRSERFRYERRRRILSLGKRIFFNEGGGGDSRSPRDSWATKKKKKTFHYHWNDVCVCVGRILRNPSLTAASFLKTQPCQAPRRRPCRAREALEILGGDRKNPAVG